MNILRLEFQYRWYPIRVSCWNFLSSWEQLILSRESNKLNACRTVCVMWHTCERDWNSLIIDLGDEWILFAMRTQTKELVWQKKTSIMWNFTSECPDGIKMSPKTTWSIKSQYKFDRWYWLTPEHREPTSHVNTTERNAAPVFQSIHKDFSVGHRHSSAITYQHMPGSQ